jgi:hypothetical protein
VTPNFGITLLTNVLVSGNDELRNRLRELVKDYLYKNVELKDLDYQIIIGSV